MSIQKIIQNFLKTSSVKGSSNNEIDNNNNQVQKSDENDENEINSYEEKAKKKLLILMKDLTILEPNIGPSWFFALESEFSKPYFKKLSNFVEEERSNSMVYPTRNNVWAWTRMCSVSEVKVVILGQHPYYNPHKAHGLCFSVPKSVEPPPSLLNIYNELKNDIEGFEPPDHGDLRGWAKQGVLLLKSSPTVGERISNAKKQEKMKRNHMIHWEKFISAVIKYISDGKKGVVFLLWGSYAHKKAKFIDHKKHHVLKTYHPAPQSAYKGFFGCKHFSKCNELLKKEGKEPINWCQL